MYILYSSEVTKDISKLDKAWSNPETFVFIAEHSGVSEDWINEGMSRFPTEFKKNKFSLLTSGTTGQPKLIIASKKRAEDLVHIIHRLQKSQYVKETILVLPLSYCYAFVNQWLWAKVYNRKYTYTKGFAEPDLMRKKLTSAKSAMICLVYPQVQLFINYFGDNASFPGLIRVHFAGGPFPQNSIDAVHHLFPNAKVFNNYGCAEAMPRLTIRSEEDSDEGSNIGRPLPRIKMKTEDTGRILFQSPYSAVGFYDNNGFVEVTTDMWIPSGDLGEEIEDGYWRIMGRANEVFKRYGEKVSIPLLLKTIFSKWNGEATFYREQEPNGEEGHVLVLCPKPTSEQYRTILTLFRKNHPRAQWPIRLESVEKIPLSGNGKIDKFALVKQTKKTIHWYQRS